MKKRHTLFSKAIVVCLMACLSSITAWADPIDVEQARQAALSFRKSTMHTGKHRVQATAAKLNHCFTKHTEAGKPAVYAFEQEGGGFVLAAADDAMPAVLGYSDNGTFDPNNIPDGLQYLLGEYAKMAASFGPLKADEQNLPEPDYKVVETEPIEPLVKTHWGQTKCYNRYTPFALTNADGNGHASTGCVATALAQIMRYHKWPEKGFGSAYQDATQGAITVPYTQDFYAHTYRWDLMHENTSEYPKNANNVYSIQSPDVEAVSSFMIDVAVALRTEFGAVSSSSHITVIPALTSYFNYDDGAKLKYIKDGIEDFNQTIIDELKAERPVFLAGGPNNAGHAFVCDGYNGRGHFHINWGWENLSDGYYLITGLTPAKEGVGGYGTGYSQGLKMVYNIKPNKGEITRPKFVINYKRDGLPGYSIAEDGNTKYFAAEYGATANRHIRGKLGMLIVDAQGQGQIVWNQHEEYSQILSLGTQGAYYKFRVNIDPAWLTPNTRAYYIYRECGEDKNTWHYTKDSNGNYCCIAFSLKNGDVVYERVGSEPTYNGNPSDYNLNTSHTFELSDKVTSLTQLQSGHVYAIKARQIGGFATLNPNGGKVVCGTNFDPNGTTAFVFTGDNTNGFTIKSAVANAYMPVLSTTRERGYDVEMSNTQEKYSIYDYNGNFSDGIQLQSNNSSFDGGKVYLNCGTMNGNFVGWHLFNGVFSQMELYEVLVDGKKTMPIDASGPIVVTYNIYLGNQKIGEKKYQEIIGRVPTADFLPYFVDAEGFPAIITGETTSYDIRTSYNDYMPFVPGTNTYNVNFKQNGTTYWWYDDGNSTNGRLVTSTLNVSDTKAQWRFEGDWLNGFKIKNATRGKYVCALNLNDNNKACVMAMDPTYGNQVFMLELNDSGYCFHLKNGAGYLAYVPSVGAYISLNSTVDNPNNLVDFVEPGKEPALSLTIGNTEYSTFYDNVPRKIPAGITAYYCTEKGDGKLNTIEIEEDVIPANVGVVLSGISGAYRFAHVNEPTLVPTGSCLTGVTEEKPVSSVLTTSTNNVYVFSRVDGEFGFYKYSNTATLQAHKAFYAPTNGANVQGFVLDFDGEQTTGIISVDDNGRECSNQSFDLAGRRVNANAKGISIINGKKVIR